MVHILEKPLTNLGSEKYVKKNELERWLQMRRDLVRDLRTDFPNAAHLAQEYFADNETPSFPELIPLFLRKASDERCQPYDEAWLLLYVTSALMDDLHDGDIQHSPQNTTAVQILSVLAASRAAAIYGASSQDVERVFRRSLLAQTKALSPESSEIDIQNAATEKNSLLSLAAIAPVNDVELDSEQQRSLQFSVQVLDDLSDLELDALGSFRTTICEPEFSSLTPDEILYQIARHGRLHNVLQQVRSLCEPMADVPTGTRTPLGFFLSDVICAIDELLVAAEGVREVDCFEDALSEIQALRNKINIYAIAS